MRILCAIHPPEAIHKILECLGLPSRPPPIARALPEHEIEGFYFSRAARGGLSAPANRSVPEARQNPSYNNAGLRYNAHCGCSKRGIAANGGL